MYRAPFHRATRTRTPHRRIALALLFALLHFAVGGAAHAHQPLRELASGVQLDVSDSQGTPEPSAPSAETCSICSAVNAGLALAAARGSEWALEERTSWASVPLRFAPAHTGWAPTASRAPPSALSASID